MLKLLKPITAINGFRIGDKVRLKDGDGRPHIIKAVVIDGLKEFFFVVQFEDGTETMLDNISPLPSDLDEAAEEYGRKEYSHAIHFWDEGLSKNKPEVMKKDFVDSFKAGAEWMAGRGWISVDERLPEMDEEVIVLSDELGTAPIYKIAFGHIVDVRCIDYNGWNIPGVKYWMPCPEIPNSD